MTKTRIRELLADKLTKDEFEKARWLEAPALIVYLVEKGLVLDTFDPSRQEGEDYDLYKLRMDLTNRTMKKYLK